MEIAVAGPILALLALALAALSARLLIETLVVAPMRGAAASVSDVPIVGGALSGAIYAMAEEVSIVAATMEWLRQPAQEQATYWWNWLVSGTFNALYGWLIRDVAAAGALAAQSYATVQWLVVNWLPYIAASLVDLYDRVARAAVTLAWITVQWVPSVEARISGAQGLLSYVATRVGWVVDIWMPSNEMRLRGIEAGVRDLSRFWEDVAVHVLPRMQQDIGARAYEGEAAALRARVGDLERTLSGLVPLAGLATLTAVELVNLRCVAGVKCDVLSMLSQSDIDERLTALEVDHG